MIGELLPLISSRNILEKVCHVFRQAHGLVDDFRVGAHGVEHHDHKGHHEQDKEKERYDFQRDAAARMGNRACHALDLFFLLEGTVTDQTEEIALDDVHEYLLGYLNRMDNRAAMPMANG